MKPNLHSAHIIQATESYITGIGLRCNRKNKNAGWGATRPASDVSKNCWRAMKTEEGILACA